MTPYKVDSYIFSDTKRLQIHASGLNE